MVLGFRAAASRSNLLGCKKVLKARGYMLGRLAEQQPIRGGQWVKFNVPYPARSARPSFRARCYAMLRSPQACRLAHVVPAAFVFLPPQIYPEHQGPGTQPLNDSPSSERERLRQLRCPAFRTAVTWSLPALIVYSSRQRPLVGAQVASVSSVDQARAQNFRSLPNGTRVTP